MDSVLEEISAATLAAQKALGTLETRLNELDTSNGMTLLGLKNEELLSYVHNSMMVLGGQLKLRNVLKEGKNKSQTGKEIRTEAIKSAISSRVALEKGVKPLESRVSYEIDKALRNYEREKAKNKAEKEDSNEEDDGSEDESEEEEEEEDNDLLAFKPNPMALMGTKSNTKKQGKTTEDSDDEEEQDDSEEEGKPRHYVAPKITSVLPTGAASLDEDGPSTRNNSRMRRNALLEEYLAETSSAPQLESSIGSTIVDGGRGVRSERDKAKEREIRDYEESNYTRLTDKVKDKHMGRNNKGRRRGPQDEFFGEKWDFGTSAKTGKKDGLYESTKKRKGQSSSVWEKASKRRG